MAGPERKGSLVISIDTDVPSRRLAMNGTAVRESFVASLIDQLAKHELTVTWSAADPATSPIVAQATRARGCHAVAAVADPSWRNGRQARRACSVELGRIVNSAAAAGLTVDTLVVLEDLTAGCWDVVAQHGIRAVRSGQLALAPPQGLLSDALALVRDRWSKAIELPRPRPVRPGLWNVPATIRLDTVSGHLRLSGNLANIRRGIDRAVDAKAIYHVVVDLAHLAANPRRGLRAMEEIARHAADPRKDGLLECLSLSEAVERFTAPRRTTRGQSILRPLAA